MSLWIDLLSVPDRFLFFDSDNPANVPSTCASGKPHNRRERAGRFSSELRAYYRVSSPSSHRSRLHVRLNLRRFTLLFRRPGRGGSRSNVKNHHLSMRDEFCMREFDRHIASPVPTVSNTLESRFPEQHRGIVSTSRPPYQLDGFLLRRSRLFEPGGQLT